MPFCNLCGNRSLVDHRKRRSIRCSACGSFDGHRLFGLLALDLLAGAPVVGAPVVEGPVAEQAPRFIMLPEAAAAMQLVQQVAPQRFAAQPVTELLAGRTFHTLFLDAGLAPFGRPPAEIFGALRRGIAPDGLVAFLLALSDEPEPVTVTPLPQADGTVLQGYAYGRGALDWFASLPGWRIEVWNPGERFGATANEEMALRYRGAERPLVLAYPRP